MIKSTAHHHGFRTTRWTLVLRAKSAGSAEGDAALGELCQQYWFPLYAFVRRKGYSPHDAQDLVQAFFERFLSKSYLQSVDRDRGRFRTFLLASLSHFLANEYDKRSCVKRGGRLQIISIDARCAEDRYQREPLDSQATPDEAFDRAWAQTLFERVISRLEDDYRKGGEIERFNALKGSLMGARAEEGYLKAGEALGLSEGGVKTVVSRMRLRFRQVLREELARTLADGMDVDEEIQHMIGALK